MICTGNGVPVTTSLIDLQPAEKLKQSSELIFVESDTVKTTFVSVVVTVCTLWQDLLQLHILYLFSINKEGKGV
jgi:hypothetical protein